MQDRQSGRLIRASLPPDPSLGRDTDATEFRRLMEQQDAFKHHPNIDAIAAAVHQSFLDGAAKSRLDAEIANQPHLAWKIHPAIEKAYDQLDADSKASNRAAARRIPEHLTLINFVVKPQERGDDGSWKDPLKAAIELHLDRLAQAEHLGWCAERVANGWTYAELRDNDLKHHNLLVDWSKLSPANRDKDHSSARSIPSVLEVAGHKAVPWTPV